VIAIIDIHFMIKNIKKISEFESYVCKWSYIKHWKFSLLALLKIL